MQQTVLYKILHYCSILFYTIDGVSPFTQKIAVQNAWNAYKQLQVDVGAGENVVYVGAVAVQLVRKPSYAALLAA